MNIRQRLPLNKSSGFTLVELLAVMAILGVILLIAIPTFQRTLADFRLQKDAEQMAWEIRGQQQEAIARGQSCQLEFYRSTNEYKIIGTETRRISLSSGVKIAYLGFPSDQYILRFNITGTPNIGGTIALTNDYGRYQYVVVSPVIGRTRVSNSHPNTAE